MVPAVEVLIGTQPVFNIIRDGKTFSLDSAIKTSQREGMTPMDQAVLNLLRARVIMVDEARLYVTTCEIGSPRFRAFDSVVEHGDAGPGGCISFP